MPRFDITELDKELAGKKLRPIYTIVGSERHLAREALKKIEDVSDADTNDLSSHIYSGKEVRGEEVVGALRTVPMLGGRPFVLIRDAEGLSKSALDVLAGYAENPLASSTLVIVAEKLDGRSRFMQLAAKTGTVIECKPLYMDRVPLWINMEVKKRSRQIAQDAAKFLADMVGNNLGSLTEAIDRIILYVGEKKLIEIKDVEECIAETHQHDIFELTDAVGTKNLRKAVALLNNIIENGESPILVVNMLARHFRILSKAKEIAGRLTDNAEIARYLGVHPFFAKNYISQSKNFSRSELKKAFSTLYKCDRALKLSRIDKKRIVEKALLSLLKK